MGQFYKGTEATFLDNAMYKPPYELMGTVIDKKDKEVDETLTADAELNSLIEKIAALEPDQKRANEIRAGYSSEIDNIANSIYADPMNSATYMPKINNLKKRITTDWSSGEVSKIQGNKALDDAWSKETKDKMKAHPELYEKDHFDRLRKTKLEQFAQQGGTAYKETGDANVYSTEDVMGLRSSTDILKDIMEGAVEGHNISISRDNDHGGWRVKTDKEEKWFKDDQLENMWGDYLLTNPNVMSAVKQRHDLGYQGYQASFDEKGSPSFQQGSWFSTANDLLKQKYGGHYTKTGGGSTMNALGVQDAQDERDTVNLSIEVGGTLNSIAGTDNKEYYARVGESTNTINASVNKGLQTYADLHYTSTKRDPLEAAKDRLEQFRTGKLGATYEKIRGGDFSPIANTPEGKELSKQHRKAEVDRAVLYAQQAQFKKETGIPYGKIADLNTKYNYTALDANGKSVKKTGTALDVWNNFLNTNSVKTVNRQMGWGMLDYTAKQQESLSKQFFGSGAEKQVPLYFPPGTMIGKHNVGGKKYSLNELMEKGIIKMINVNNPSGQAPIVPGSSLMEDKYQIVGSSEYLNFDKSPKSFAPIAGYNNSDQIEFGFGVTIHGKTFLGRADGISTDALKQLNSGDNALRFKTDAYLTKNAGNLEAFTIPGTDKVYHGKDVIVNGKKIYSKGTVTYKENGVTKTDYADSPEVQIALGRLIFQ